MQADPRHDTTAPTPLAARLKAVGQALREGRERRGLSLEELSLRLHMGLEQLQALEAGEASRLPERVYVIAQARRIAGFLELSIDPLIEALRQCPAPQVAAAEGSEAAGPAGAIAARLLGRSAAASQEPLPLGERHERPAQDVLENPAPTSVPGRAWWRPLMAAVLLVGAISGGTAFWRQGLRLPNPRLTPGSGAPVERGTAPLAPATAPAAVRAGELLLRATGPSWLEVRNAAGQRLYFKTLKGEQRFPIGAGLRLTAGRPDLIQVRTAAQPTRVLGRIDDQRWWMIQPDGRLKMRQGHPR